MNQVVAIPANWFQILDSVTSAVRPVFAMVDLLSPVVVAAAAFVRQSVVRISRQWDLVHLAHQNANASSSKAFGSPLFDPSLIVA